MVTRTCHVGVHGRNQERWADLDYQVVREANLEAVKMMSLSVPDVFERLKRENPDLEIITRLYDDRISAGGHPTAQEFAEKMMPIMRALQPYCVKFQIHNEPNHRDRIEGWGATDEDAQSFGQWFLQVYDRLKSACPWASLGFPGLAIPTFIHRDRDWLRICRPAVERADWLGVHCYWQTPPDRPSVIFDPNFGLTFKYYHAQFPNKALEILECGNSNVQSDWHNRWAIPDEDVAQEYVKWLQEVFKYDYVNSASFFILSSPDQANWAFFCWRTENNYEKPVVQRVGQMFRPALGAAPGPTPPQPPVVVPPPPVQWTNQQMITAFQRAAVKLGLGNWALMQRAKIKLGDLVKDRQAPYRGPAIDQLPNLTADQKALVKQVLASLVAPAPELAFGLVEGPRFLWQQSELATVSLALPRSQHLRPASSGNRVERQVVRTWNRYGYLLTQVADLLGIDPGVAVAVLAAQAARRGLAPNGCLTIRFENDVFYDEWGWQHREAFYRHFRFDPDRPWQKHQWRPGAGQNWQESHGSQVDEWAAFNLARTLDERAAKLSLGMGMAQMMGFGYAALGYSSAEQMFDAFSSGERQQILAVFDFIAGPSAGSRQLSSLRERDFYAFAALHYGSKQAARYGHLLKNLYEAYQRLQPL
jgi:hypothetical protein